MSKTKIVAFVGMPGSGKGTCSDYLHDKYEWPLIHFGSMVYEEVQRRGLHNVHDEVFVREDMRKTEGPAVLAKHVARKADEFFMEGHDIVIFDGLYSWTEYKFLEEYFGDSMLVIAIAAPKKLRRERVIERKDSHRSYTHEQLIAREIAEIENIEKGGPIAFADYTVVNDDTLDDFISKLEKIITTEQIIQLK